MTPLHTLQRIAPDEGQAMVEYALLLGLVTVASVGVLSTMGASVGGMYAAVQAALSAVPGA
jgi:Flp pilus assembly pilin Flp